jgi:putative IMPACT (imprinted ancient) family translation regulator
MILQTQAARVLVVHHSRVAMQSCLATLKQSSHLSNLEKVIESLVVLDNGKISPTFSVEQRAFKQFMESGSAPRSIKSYLDKANKCEKLLQMVSKSRRRLFALSLESKAMSLLRSVVSEEKVAVICEAPIEDHFDLIMQELHTLKDKISKN